MYLLKRSTSSFTRRVFTTLALVLLLLPSAQALTELSPDGDQRGAMKEMLQRLERGHYVKLEVDDSASS